MSIQDTLSNGRSGPFSRASASFEFRDCLKFGPARQWEASGVFLYVVGIGPRPKLALLRRDVDVGDGIINGRISVCASVGVINWFA